MEFLVRVRVTFPLDMDPAEKQRIMVAEREEGARQRAAGILLRTWRIPGRVETISLWRVADPTELHTIHAALPVFPYCNIVEVEALAEHPIDPTSHAARGPDGS